MAQKNTPARKNNKAAYGLLAIIIIAAVVGYGLFRHHQNNVDAAKLAAQTVKAQQADGDQVKKQTNDATSGQSPGSTSSSPTGTISTTSGDTSSSGSSSTTTKPQTVSLTLTALNQTATTLQIRTQIAADTSTGDCTLTLTKGSDVQTYTAGVQPLASSATCQGFDIPLTKLSNGDWSVAVAFSDATQNIVGNTSGKITIK